MTLQNLFAFSFGALCLFQVSPIFTPTPVSVSNEIAVAGKTAKTELPPELKKKSLELLANVATESQQFREPANRVRATILIADLQWQYDEPQARILYQNALNDVQSLLASLNPNPDDDAAAEQVTLEYSLSALRREFLLSYAIHDANAALAALQSLKTPTNGQYDALSTEGLELEIASAATRQNPTRAYEIARAKLQDGFSSSFNETLKNLYKINPENGAKLARDILSKIKSSKVVKDADLVPNETIETPTKTITKLGFSDVTTFLQTASTLNKSGARNKDKKQVPVLSDDEMKDLTTFVAQTFLALKDDSPYTIGSVSKVIVQYAPSYNAQIRQRLGATVKEYDSVAEYSDLYTNQEEKSADEMAAEAEKLTDQGVRDSMLAQAVSKALAKDDVANARAITAKIKDKDQLKYANDQIKEAMPLINARKGDLGEVRKLLGTKKSVDERITILTELATTFAGKSDKESKENALKLIDEANQLLNGRVKHKTDLDATLQIAAAYAKIQPERAFVMLENSISQMNDLITAGIAINDFYEQGAVTNDELNFENMQLQANLHVSKSVEMLKTLSRFDFERTANLSDKFARPEVRMLMKLKLAQSLLDPNALESEQKAIKLQSESEVGD